MRSLKPVDNLGPHLASAASSAADSAKPVLDKAADRAQQVVHDTVFPAVASAASNAADVALEHGRDLLERVAETERVQELARRAALVAAATRGEAPKRWPLLVAGLGAGVLLGAFLGRRTASTPLPAAIDPTDNGTTGTTGTSGADDAAGDSTS